MAGGGDGVAYVRCAIEPLVGVVIVVAADVVVVIRSRPRVSGRCCLGGFPCFFGATAPSSSTYLCTMETFLRKEKVLVR